MPIRLPIRPSIQAHAIHPVCAAFLLMFGCSFAAAQVGEPADTMRVIVSEPADDGPATVPAVGRADVRGSGPIPMILLPHLGLSGAQFEAFMTANADRYTMHAITPAGFGGTTPMAFDDPASWREAPRLEALEAGVIDYITTNALDRPVILGHAMGGHVVWRLLADHPGRFRAGVILDGLPSYPIADLAEDPAERARIVDTIFAPQALTMPEAAWTQQWRFLLGTLMRDPARAAEIAAEFNTVPRDIAARYYLEMIGSDLTENIRTITTPTLIIAALPADTGQAMSIEERRRLWMDTADTVPGARVEFFKNTGQFITEDAPAELNRAVERFLASVMEDDATQPEATQPQAGQPKGGGDDE